MSAERFPYPPYHTAAAGRSFFSEQPVLAQHREAGRESPIPSLPPQTQDVADEAAQALGQVEADVAPLEGWVRDREAGGVG